MTTLPSVTTQLSSPVTTSTTAYCHGIRPTTGSNKDYFALKFGTNQIMIHQEL